MHRVLVPFLAVVLLGAVACSSGSAGRAVPATGTTEAAPATSSGSVDDLDPCELLSSSELSRLGAPAQGEAEELAGVRHCDWRVEKNTAAASYTLSVQVLGKVGLADVNGTGKQDIEVGSHKGVRSTRPSGVACVVSIEVAEKARVDVVVTGGEAASRCGPAEEAAGFVEPRLP